MLRLLQLRSRPVPRIRDGLFRRFSQGLGHLLERARARNQQRIAATIHGHVMPDPPPKLDHENLDAYQCAIAFLRLALRIASSLPRGESEL